MILKVKLFLLNINFVKFVLTKETGKFLFI